MRKFYILDTNVLLHDPSSMLSFQDNDVVVPIYVIEEVDHFKRQQTELGQNARRVSRLLDELRQRGKLSEGVPTDGGGTLRVCFDDGVPLQRVAGESNLVDNALLAMARSLAERHPERPVVLVSKDTNLRIKADAMELQAEDFETGRVDVADLYEGHADLVVEADVLEALQQRQPVPVPAPGLFPNEYVRLRLPDGGRRSVLGRVDAEAATVLPLSPQVAEVWGLRPRNMEQHFALDALLDDRLALVTLMGKAGTGKTLLALAGGLQKTRAEHVYVRLLVSRPIFPMGRDLGFLPGTLDEKLGPWMQPIHDNLALLVARAAGARKSAHGAERLIDEGVLAVEPLTYIRGRSIPRQFMIVDEAQNLTPLEIKTIVTRVGEGTKLVLTGDPFQIDNPYIDSSSNGFNTVVQRFRPEPMAAHVHLVRGERSALAERASDIL